MIERGRMWSRLVLVSAAVAFVGCGKGDQDKFLSQERAALTAPTTSTPQMVQFHVSLPPGAQPTDVLLGASGNLTFDDGVRLDDSTGATSISNAGPGTTTVGISTIVGDKNGIPEISDCQGVPRPPALMTKGTLVSAAPVSLHQNVDVTGNVLAATQPTFQTGAHVDGSLTVQPSLSFSTVSWGVFFPGVSNADKTIQKGQTVSLSPGNYGTVAIDSGGTLKLTAGSYTFVSLLEHGGASVQVDTSGGPAAIYVQSLIDLSGKLVPSGGASTLFLGYAGTAAFIVQNAFAGTLVAPNASVTLASLSNAPAGDQKTGHRGAFFAATLDVHHCVSIVHAPYAAWSALTSPPGGGTVLAGRPPRQLPQPPKAIGCYAGTANGWASIPCAPSGTLGKILTTETAIETPNGASPTVPFQFGQVETTFTAFGSETDSGGTANAFSLQGNTNFFNSTTAIPGTTVGDQAWVQFVAQPAGASTTLKIETWDITKFRNAGSVCPGNLCAFSCGCTDIGVTSVPNRPTGYAQFDFGTAAGSVYKDDSGNPLIGMVIEFSWFDPKNDPGNKRGLYSIVTADQYGLASGWTNFSGTILGNGGGSSANFTNSSVLTRTLAGSCANGSTPVKGIPWPGVCTGSSDLLTDTTTGQVSPTAETDNMCKVGTDTTLAEANSNLVWTQNLFSTSCAPTPTCISTSNRVFVRSTDEDTGVRPINFGTQAFWESPDLLLVPGGTKNVNVNFISSETVLTPGAAYDVYVRVNNDFGCNTVTGAKALVYIADPTALSASWVSITGGTYQGNVAVPAGQQGLLGPFSFTAPMNVPGNGHKCLLAAIAADGEPGPAITTDPLSSYQVGQRNLQFSNCVLPLTNGTPTNGNVSLTLTAKGAAPALTGGDVFSVSFDDPSQVWFNTWVPGAGAAYSVTQAGGKTTVQLGQVSVTLAAVPLAAGVTINGTATVTLSVGDPESTLQVAAQLSDAMGNALVSNGLSCVGFPPAIIR